MQKWKLKYGLSKEIGTFTKRDVDNDNVGLADAFIFFSLVYPEDGSFSMFYLSVDGRNEGKQLADSEYFKIWTLLAHNLSNSETLRPDQRALVESVFQVIKDAHKPNKHPTPDFEITNGELREIKK